MLSFMSYDERYFRAAHIFGGYLKNANYAEIMYTVDVLRVYHISHFFLGPQSRCGIIKIHSESTVFLINIENPLQEINPHHPGLLCM